MLFQAPSCDIYHSVSNPDNCLTGTCGSCFNPGARPGVLCRGQQTGYYCAASSPSAGADMAFACMDWTFGSQSMLKAEASWNARSGEPPVYFGVGTYGTGSDPIRGLGACYHIEATGVDRTLLVQSINTGSDVAANQFDLMIGDGGAGAFDVCAGGKANATMFPGTTAPWGKIYGGVDNRAQCAGLPPYPIYDGPMKAAGDNLVALCQYGFDKKVRQEGGGNPTITSVTRVACPGELVALTQIKRTDDPPGPGPAPPTPGPNPRPPPPTPPPTPPGPSPGPGPGPGPTPSGCPGGTLAACIALCPSNPPVAYQACVQACVQRCPPSAAAAAAGDSTPRRLQASGMLTRMMDCRKPSGAWKDNVGSLTARGMKLVQPCTADGYTRIDVQCGCPDCYC